MSSVQPGEWIAVADRLPENAGDYVCRLTVHDPVSGEVERTLEAKRRFRLGKDGKGYWFGGMRPFTDHQQVTHWCDSPG